MLICRFAAGEDIWYGAVDGLADDDSITEDSIVAPIEGHPFVDIRPEGSVLKLADVRLLAPVLPSKVVCVGKNYRAHAAEMGGEVPEEPLLFAKPSTSVIGSGDPIDLPWQSEKVEHEGELAVVIGRMCKDVPIDRVDDVIFGYTCANDVTASDLQAKDGQWLRAKGFDTFCPLGPWIQTELKPADADLTVTVNGAAAAAFGNRRDGARRPRASRLHQFLHDVATWRRDLDRDTRRSWAAAARRFGERVHHRNRDADKPREE